MRVPVCASFPCHWCDSSGHLHPCSDDVHPGIPGRRVQHRVLQRYGAQCDGLASSAYFLLALTCIGVMPCAATWFLQKQGRADSSANKVFTALFVVTFFVLRVVWMPYATYDVMVLHTAAWHEMVRTCSTFAFSCCAEAHLSIWVISSCVCACVCGYTTPIPPGSVQVCTGSFACAFVCRDTTSRVFPNRLVHRCPSAFCSIIGSL